MNKYTYKWCDISSGKLVKKIKFTSGQFAGWTQPMGLANVPYAVFRTRRTEILVPRYDVTNETLERIGGPAA